MKWIVNNDAFSFDISLDEKPGTWRDMLSTLVSFFLAAGEESAARNVSEGYSMGLTTAQKFTPIVGKLSEKSRKSEKAPNPHMLCS